MSTECRQHYRLATGEGLTEAPPKNPNPGLKKGGHVKKHHFKKGGQNKAGSHGHSYMVAGKSDNC